MNTLPIPCAFWAHVSRSDAFAETPSDIPGRYYLIKFFGDARDVLFVQCREEEMWSHPGWEPIEEPFTEVRLFPLLLDTDRVIAADDITPVMLKENLLSMGVTPEDMIGEFFHRVGKAPAFVGDRPLDPAEIFPRMDYFNGPSEGGNYWYDPVWDHPRRLPLEGLLPPILSPVLALDFEPCDEDCKFQRDDFEKEFPGLFWRREAGEKVRVAAVGCLHVKSFAALAAAVGRRAFGQGMGTIASVAVVLC